LVLFNDDRIAEEREQALVFYGVYMQEQKVKVTVKSVNDTGSGIEKLEVVSFGTLRERNGSWYARYAESETTGFAGTHTTIKWNQERIVVLRSGSLEHRQEFFPGLEIDTIYKTPYMEIPMRIVTKTVSIKQHSASKWNLNVDYEVHYFETERNHIKLNIVIEEDK
jgi:uncharacterized beta-barrel protein YwiB (DUF1934 family)